LDYVEFTLMEHAIPGETPHDLPMGPLVNPGTYTVALTVDGKTYKQPVTITLDPRVKVAAQDLDAQLETEKKIAAQMATSYDGYDASSALLKEVTAVQKQTTGDLAKTLEDYAAQVKRVSDGNPAQQEMGDAPVNGVRARWVD